MSLNAKHDCQEVDLHQMGLFLGYWMLYRCVVCGKVFAFSLDSLPPWAKTSKEKEA